MTLTQRVCMVVAALSMSTLSLACQHVRAGAGSGLSVTPPITTIVDPGTPDGGEAEAEAPAPEASTKTGLVKPKEQKHFVPTLTFSGEVTSDSAAEVKAMVAVLNASRHDPQQDPVEAVVLIINTPGGEVGAGTVIVEALQSLEMPLVCIVDPDAYSMGFIMLEAACPVRLITDRGSLMAHEAHLMGQVSLTNPSRLDFQSVADEMRVTLQGWLNIAAKRMHMDVKALEDRIRGVEWFMDADEALKVQAVDGIVNNIERDVVKPLQQGLALPPRLGVPAALLQAPVAPLPEPQSGPAAGNHRQHRHQR